MPDLRGPDRQPAFLGIPTYIHSPLALSQGELAEMQADVAIIGAPVDMGVVNRPGARFGPRAIRQAGYSGSPNDTFYHMEYELYPTQVIKVVDFGDANCPPSSLEQSHEAVRMKTMQALQTGALPLVLGGDHSITLPAATAVAQHHGYGRVGMIHFDAHADTGESGYGGVLIAHGSPMRRLLESGAIPGPNFIQIGLRGYWPDKPLFDWMQGQGMRWHLMAEIVERGFDAVLDDAICEALDGPEVIYLSVDIDVLDPAFAPATGTPEPGGMTSAQLLKAVRTIVSSVELVGADIVEVAPHYEGPAAITAEVANRVGLEIISALAHRRASA